MGSRRWDGEAGPSLFDWDTEAPEHTAVGSSPPPELRCTEAGRCHSPHAAECCRSQWHREFFAFLPKKSGAAPQPRRALLPLPAGLAASHPAGLQPLGKGSASTGAGGSDKDSPGFGIHKPLDQLSCTVYRFSLGLHLWSETRGRHSSLSVHMWESAALAVTVSCFVYCSPK